MCGRFTMTAEKEDIMSEFEISLCDIDFKPAYNIAPTQEVIVLLKEKNFQLFRWGLIPSWAKEINSKYHMINARAESLTEKQAYRSLVKEKRCIIIGDGFYEWQKRGNKKIPFYIRLKSGGIFGFAGLWDKWVSPDKEKIIKSCTIITTEANDFMKIIHNRMPAILTGMNIFEWLEGGEITGLKEGNKDEFYAYPVTDYVNSPKNNSPECIKPLERNVDL